MKPRSLRHRLEKSAKLLWQIQKHHADADAFFNPERGEHGQVILDFERQFQPPDWAGKLGGELEGKGYAFTRTLNPWLGECTLRGRREGQPDVIFQLGCPIDRSSVTGETRNEPWSFKD
ncbi:MAG: hypothetical protein ACFB20_07060 [Opitutales bacterium]